MNKQQEHNQFIEDLKLSHIDKSVIITEHKNNTIITSIDRFFTCEDLLYIIQLIRPYIKLKVVYEDGNKITVE